WHVQTPLELCKAWNKQRLRQVPDAVIDEYFQSLKDNPPQVEEGFVAINSVLLTQKEFDWVQVEYMLKQR
ncbi:MAG TPA: hypothetical protein DCP31_22960, partial [Cyanobacteria bacterium UBA8543]|nr:hypothetical protein [Cyanobacteria bacterium UBA8543]